MNKIFKKEYVMWWFILAVIISLKYIVFGKSEDSLWDTKTYANYGIMFIVIGTLFTSVIFAMPFYGLYGIISKKWNEKIFMVVISIFSLILIILD